MVRRVSKLEQKRRLRGWRKYAPALLLFFAAVSIDAYLSKQMREIDYEQGRLKTIERQLKAELNTLEASTTPYQNVGMLEEQSILLGMVNPQPQQIVAVRVDYAAPTEPVLREDMLAQVDPVETPDLRAFLREPMGEVATATLAAASEEESLAAVAPVEVNYAAALEEDPEVLLEAL